MVEYSEEHVLDKHPELVIPGAGPSRVTLPELQDELSPHLSDEETRSVIKVEQIVDEIVDPLPCGSNNNPLLPDGFDQDIAGGAIDTDTNYDDNDVKIISCLPPKKSRTGQKSQSPECEEMVSTTNMSRHIKRYHYCPAGKNYKSKSSSIPKSVKIKCEFCGKGLAKTSLTKHIRMVHQRKRCHREEGRKFTCAECGVVFKSRDLIRLHVSKCPAVKTKLLLHEAQVHIQGVEEKSCINLPNDPLKEKNFS